MHHILNKMCLENIGDINVNKLSKESNIELSSDKNYEVVCYMTTSFFNEIGGYLGLELGQSFDNISNGIALNCARNCLRYVIRAFNIKEIYLPYYTCPVVWQSVQKENIKIKFYHIDKIFMPNNDIPTEAYILYTNYFGICANNVKTLSKRYKNLIIDNSQAFYMPKYGIASFNSIRKFFGVSDGALLFTDKILSENFEQDTSFDRCSHLLKRLDVDAKFGYQDFQINDDIFSNESIKKISNLTKAIFNSIDIEKAKQKRLNNFEFLHSVLKQTNELRIALDSEDVPLVYPYMVKDKGELLRQTLIKKKIYVASYWNPMPEEYQEGIFQKYIIPLPIDQRYGKEDMEKILNVIDE